MMRSEDKPEKAQRRLWTRARRRARSLTRRLAKSDRGATAIEFGIVALVFFTLIFAILELALVFFTSSVLGHAVSDAGRTIRVGQYQSCGTEDEFRDLVCSRMRNLMNCRQNLRVDVLSQPRFSQFVMPTLTDGGLDGTTPNQQVTNGAYQANSAGDPVGVRATFYYPLILPPAMTRLETKTAGGAPVVSGRRVIVAMTAFRNEPFPTSTSCDADLAAEIASVGS
jgi:Flp pilus assembly protein TadG